jgi:hypothetical protein
MRATLREFADLSSGGMTLLAGKRLHPFWIYVALAVIVVSLALLFWTRHTTPAPDNTPMHVPTD